MKKDLKRLFLLVVPIIALIVLYSLRTRDTHVGSSNEFKAWAEEDVKEWESKTYVPIKDRADLLARLEKLRIGGESLDAKMRAAYLEALADFFLSHHEGTLEAWKRFRFNGNQPHTMTSNGLFHVQFYNGIVRLERRTFPSFSPNDPQFNKKWEMRVTNSTPPVIARDSEYEGLFFKFLHEISYDTDYKNYFTDVSLSDAVVKHETVKNYPEPLVKFPFFPKRVYRGHAVDSTFPNLGYVEFDNGRPAKSFFTVQPTLATVLEKQGSVPCISGFFYVRLNEKGRVAPFLIRHFWSAADNRWMVTELVNAHILPDRQTHIVF